MFWFLIQLYLQISFPGGIMRMNGLIASCLLCDKEMWCCHDVFTHTHTHIFRNVYIFQKIWRPKMMLLFLSGFYSRTFGVHIWSDSLTHNLNPALFWKYLTLDCLAHLEQQFSVTYVYRDIALSWRYLEVSQTLYILQMWMGWAMFVILMLRCYLLPHKLSFRRLLPVIEVGGSGSCKHGTLHKFLPIDPLSAGAHTWSDNLEHNSSKRVMFEKYLKEDWFNQKDKQLSVKYFSNKISKGIYFFSFCHYLLQFWIIFPEYLSQTLTMNFVYVLTVSTVLYVLPICLVVWEYANTVLHMKHEHDDQARM